MGLVASGRGGGRFGRASQGRPRQRPSTKINDKGSHLPCGRGRSGGVVKGSRTHPWSLLEVTASKPPSKSHPLVAIVRLRGVQEGWHDSTTPARCWRSLYGWQRGNGRQNGGRANNNILPWTLAGSQGAFARQTPDSRGIHTRTACRTQAVRGGGGRSTSLAEPWAVRHCSQGTVAHCRGNILMPPSTSY